MNIILNDSNYNIGGVETFLFDLANLLSHDHNVYFLVNDHNSYYEVKNKNKKIIFIYKNRSTSVEFLSLRSIQREKIHVLSQIELEVDYHVISFYFSTFQYALAIFGERVNFKLLHFWAHPQSWINSLSFWGINKFIISKKLSSRKKYRYQKLLMSSISKNLADFCGLNKKLIDYNNWFYETKLELNPYSFPFSTLSKCNDYNKIFNIHKSSMLKVLWVGRFDWFKNDAIEYIIKSLEYISNNYSDYGITFDLAGYGSKKFEESIMNITNASSLNINILGKIQYDDLPELFSHYDLGIGMGLTVKNMADCLLPSILIDSINEVNIFDSCCEWFFDSELDDSGDGFYHSVSGVIQSKKRLIDLIVPLIENRSDLNEISKKTKVFFDAHYSMQNNMQSFLILLEKSKFSGTNFKIYRSPMLLRILYNFFGVMTGKQKTKVLTFLNNYLN